MPEAVDILDPQRVQRHRFHVSHQLVLLAVTFGVIAGLIALAIQVPLGIDSSHGPTGAAVGGAIGTTVVQLARKRRRPESERE